MTDHRAWIWQTWNELAGLPWRPRGRVLSLRDVQWRHSFGRLRPSTSHRIITCGLTWRLTIYFRPPRGRGLNRRCRLFCHRHCDLHVALDGGSTVATVVKCTSVRHGGHCDAIDRRHAARCDAVCWRHGLLGLGFPPPRLVSPRPDPGVVGVGCRRINGALGLVGRRRWLVWIPLVLVGRSLL